MSNFGPEQLDPLKDIEGWSLDESAMKRINGTLAEHIKDPVGPEFLAPPERKQDVLGGVTLPFSGLRCIRSFYLVFA